MSRKICEIQSITAGRDSITFRVCCGCGPEEGGPGMEADTGISVYELEPFESAGKVEEKEPLEVKSLLGEGGGVYSLEVDRFHHGRDSLYSRFLLYCGCPGAGNATLFEGPCYAGLSGGTAQYEYPFPEAKSIKGLQVHMTEDAVKLGINHAALNLNQANIMLPGPGEGVEVYRMDGEEYYFNSRYLASFDRRLKDLSDHGIVVYLILLNSMKWDGEQIHPDMREVLAHPDYDGEGFISAFNTVTPEGLRHYKAFVEFVAERYTRPDQRYGRACGFIVGNEVNSQWVWCNAGEKAVEEYVEQYGVALRTTYYAARKKYSGARVYLSLDHFWTLRYQDNKRRYYAGKDIIDILNQNSRRDGNFDWSVAYHPYPENLFHADFWNDGTASGTFDTGRITFKNIEMLPRYMNRDELLYEGRVRHIILSEQGFHSEENEDSENLAAAAYCLAYRKIENCREIEAFLLHAHVDNRDEFGLNLGIWRRDRNSPEASRALSPKPIYHFMKEMDGPGRERVCREAEEIIGPRIWNRMLGGERNGAEC